MTDSLFPRSRMPAYSKILSFLLVLSLVGCATGKVDSLAPADKKEEIVLSEKLSTEYFAISGLRWEHILLPGTYVAERKNPEGVFFFGAGRPIVRTTKIFNQNKPHALKGGIFVPNDVSVPPELFYIFEGNTFYTVDDVDSYIAQRANAGLVPTNSKDNLGSGMVISYATQPALTPASVTSMQAGIGAALGMGVVAGIIELGKGNVEFIPRTKDPVVDAKIRAARHAVESTRVTATVGAN